MSIITKVSKIILVPGNGVGEIENCLWYSYLKQNIEKDLGIHVTVKNFPDPYLARESKWIPHLVENLEMDEFTILVGHSSGAACTLRFFFNSESIC
jgi:predicted alpha/beta hydrolase family esterase